MSIVLLIIGLIIVAFVGQKITTKLTKCPNCNKTGKSKYLGRRLTAKGRGFSGRSYSSKQGRSRNSKHYNENYECQACGHRFSKRRVSRSS